MKRVAQIIGAGILALTTGTAFAGEAIIVSGHHSIETREDRAINACARAMGARMFPGSDLIAVAARNGGNQVFNDPEENALPGFEMAVLLGATDAKTGSKLGTAECDVTAGAQVVALRPGVESLPPVLGLP